jgi:hypothetical protein
MYGFPTQSEQETIDSLEIVRMLFEHGLLHSAHWHQFAMTAHSPVGLNPEKYGVIRVGPEFKGFANNDLYHEDPQGANHERYGEGLKKALYNYMHGNGMNFPLQKFFSFSIPKPKVHPLTIANAIKTNLPDPIDTPGYMVFWQGESMKVLQVSGEITEGLIVLKRGHLKINLPSDVFQYFNSNAGAMSLGSKGASLQHVLNELSTLTRLDREQIVRAQWWKELRTALWVIKLSE